VMKIRDEQKFAGVVELHKQLVEDRTFALNVLSNEILEQI